MMLFWEDDPDDDSDGENLPACVRVVTNLLFRTENLPDACDIMA